MKNLGKSLILAVVFVALASVGAAATIGIGATQTYGIPVVNAGQTAAVWVSLASLGTTLGTTITPGTTMLNFFATGGICFNGGGSPCVTDVSVASLSNPIVGGFTAAATNVFLASGLAGINTQATGDWTTDIANDFAVNSGGTGDVLVPVGANFVVFVFRDGFYQDNADNSPVDFGVNVTAVNPSGVPEPATYAMMMAGLAAIAGFKRYRRS